MPFGKNSLKSLYPKVGDILNPTPTNFQAQKLCASISPPLKKFKTILSSMLSLLDTARTKEDCLREDWRPKEAISGIVFIALLLNWVENVVQC